jgi:hypothetical protein
MSQYQLIQVVGQVYLAFYTRLCYTGCMRFLRIADSPLVHMVHSEGLASLCGASAAYMEWKYPQTPFSLDYLCDTCKAEWVILQMAGYTVYLYNWFDSKADRVYNAKEGFDGLLY